MRLKLKEPIKDGSIRVVKRFALFPIKIGSVIKWMETVYVQQEFYGYIGDEFTGAWDVWINKKFIES